MDTVILIDFYWQPSFLKNVIFKKLNMSSNTRSTTSWTTIGSVLLVAITLAIQVLLHFYSTSNTQNPTRALCKRNLVVRSKRVVKNAQSTAVPASIHIIEGKIAKISGWDDISVTDLPLDCQLLVDAGNDVIIPGMVDTHVHGNDPGRSHWEGFETVTKGAAAGGVTTMIDMPLNSLPPTTTVENLKKKIETSAGRIYVDVGFLGGVMPGNTNDLIPLHEAGVLGFKSFMINSGVEEFVWVNSTHVEQAVKVLKDLDTVYMFHAEIEIEQVEQANREIAKTGNGTKYATYLATRPPIMEVEAIKLLVNVCDQSDIKLRCHVVHVSTYEAFDILKQHPRITAETCTHYLYFNAESIPDGATKFKCAPPIRSAENRERLWQGMRDGVLSMVTSDHSPSPPEMKNDNFLKSWGGISSLELSLPALWREASIHGFGFNDIVKWKCEEPAKLVKLDHKKGKIEIGYDADLVIWNPDASYVMDSTQSKLYHHRHHSTPYDGHVLRGVVKMTILRGNVIFTSDSDLEIEPQGSLIMREK
jgi:allantoinase